MIPVGGYYTIDAAQARALVEAVKPRIVIPMHYRSDTFGYDVIGRLEDYTKLCRDVVTYASASMVLEKRHAGPDRRFKSVTAWGCCKRAVSGPVQQDNLITFSGKRHDSGHAAFPFIMLTPVSLLYLNRMLHVEDLFLPFNFPFQLFLCRQ